jgi:phage terminase large subunit GpA-like protein
VYACKGKGGLGLQIARPGKAKVGPARTPLTVWIVGTDTAKRHVISWLGIPRPGPGYCHFPADRPAYDEEHFAQLTAERWVQRTSTWEKTRERNEALDCRVYALAARMVVNPSWGQLRKRFEAAVLRSGGEVAELPEEAEDTTAARDRQNLRKIVVNRRRAGSWRDRWR